MSSSLYKLSDGKITEVTEITYDREADLQKIIADNPNILLRNIDSDDMFHFDLFLIKREQSVQSLSLDHLMVDRDGVPVLVEVKRSSDEKIYREVVAQMIDYAARVSSLDITELKRQFEINNPDADEELLSQEFWDTVANNLRAEKIKLVFAADSIPDSLKIMIEFLDRAMPNIEVYGVEIHQYLSGDTHLLSTEYIENTLTANVKSSRDKKTWDHDSTINYIIENGFSEFLNVWNACLETAAELGIPYVYGTGRTYPSLLLKSSDLTIAALGVDSSKSYIEVGSKYLANHLGCTNDDIHSLMPDIKGRIFTKERVEFYNTTSDSIAPITKMIRALVEFISSKS